MSERVKDWLAALSLALLAAFYVLVLVSDATRGAWGWLAALLSVSVLALVLSWWSVRRSGRNRTRR